MGDLLESSRVASLFFSVFLFFLLKCMTLELLDRDAKHLAMIPFRKAQRELSDE